VTNNNIFHFALGSTNTTVWHYYIHIPGSHSHLCKVMLGSTSGRFTFLLQLANYPTGPCKQLPNHDRSERKVWRVASKQNSNF